MNAKKLAERVAVVEKEIAAAQERANMPQVAPPMPMAPVGMEACKEEYKPRPSKAERRAKLIAAHVALEAVRFELDGWSAVEEVSNKILAAMGRLELRD